MNLYLYKHMLWTNKNNNILLKQECLPCVQVIDCWLFSDWTFFFFTFTSFQCTVVWYLYQIYLNQIKEFFIILFCITTGTCIYQWGTLPPSYRNSKREEGSPIDKNKCLCTEICFLFMFILLIKKMLWLWTRQETLYLYLYIHVYV